MNTYEYICQTYHMHKLMQVDTGCASCTTSQRKKIPKVQSESLVFRHGGSWITIQASVDVASHSVDVVGFSPKRTGAEGA